MSFEAADRIRCELDTHGFCFLPMRPSLDVSQRATWLLETARAIDVLSADVPDLLVWAAPGVEVGGPFVLCELVFGAFLPSTTAEDLRRAFA